jgi:Sulfotransferase domain
MSSAAHEAKQTFSQTWTMLSRGMFSASYHSQDRQTPNPITGTASNEDMESILRDRGALLDYPVGIAFAEVYAAYPDAKCILVRNNMSTMPYIC